MLPWGVARILDSRLYWLVSRASNLFLLNLLWLVSCLPLVTVPPATAALFGVVREWRRDRDAPFYVPFFYHFKESFWQSLGLGLLWLLLGGALLSNFLLLGRMPSALQLPALLLLALWTLLYLCTSVALFPVMVAYRLGLWEVVRGAAVISLSQFGLTALCLLVIALSVTLFLLQPATLLVSGSLTAHLVYGLYARAFRRVERLRAAAPDTPRRNSTRTRLLDATQRDPLDKGALEEQEDDDDGQHD